MSKKIALSLCMALSFFMGSIAQAAPAVERTCKKVDGVCPSNCHMDRNICHAGVAHQSKTQ